MLLTLLTNRPNITSATVKATNGYSFRTTITTGSEGRNLNKLNIDSPSNRK
jgi:hypothetical protein